MAELTVTLKTAADTREFGAQLGSLVDAGDLVVLSGPLGAGKTVFVQGLGAGLGVDGPVISPTFVIARIHRGGRLPLIHVDAYRLASTLEVDDLDLDAEVADSVTAVEWGDGLVEQLADSYLHVLLAPTADDARTVVVRAVGEAWADRWPKLAAIGPRT